MFSKAVSLTLAAGIAVAWFVAAAGAQDSLDKLEKRIEELPEPPKRPLEPGFLGLVADNLRVGEGVRINAIHVGGPAASAGLQPGDIIASIAGLPIRSLDEMGAALARHTAGELIEIEIRRGIRRSKIAVTLGRKADRRSPLVIESEPRPKLGVIVSPVTNESRERLGLTVAQGAVIDSVRPGSPAERAELPVGAAIVAIDGMRVDSPAQLIALVGALRPDQEVELSFYLRDQLYRKKVRMTPAAAVATDTPAPDSGVAEKVADAAGGALDRLERTFKPAPITKTAATPLEEMTAIKREMAALQSRFEALQRRLAELEKRVASDGEK